MQIDETYRVLSFHEETLLHFAADLDTYNF